MKQRDYKDLVGLLINSAQDTWRAGGGKGRVMVVVVVSTVIIVYTAG